MSLANILKIDRKIKEAELNIIKRLETLSIEPSMLDDIVEIIHDELNNIV